MVNKTYMEHREELKKANRFKEFVVDPDVLVNNLSFSHIREIMVLNDAFERFFMKQSV